MNRRGFTLIELLVVVLILGILAAVAMPVYFKAVERSRMMEAVQMLRTISSSQQRKYIQMGRYAQKFTGLDATLTSEKNDTDDVLYTQGITGNGFEVVLSADTGYVAGNVVATRAANGSATDPGLQYQYHLIRYYASDLIQCNGDNERGKELCADYCGIDAPQDTCCSDGASECAAPISGNETSVS